MIPLTVTTYERRYRNTVLDLLYNCYHVHLQLDWYTAEQWLDSQTGMIRLAWQERRLVGVMGASEPLNATAWLRLIVVRDHAPTSLVLAALWDSLKTALRAKAIRSVWILVSNDWLSDFTPALGFEQDETVITLRRSGGEVPPVRPTTIRLQPIELEDIAAMTKVDQAAFAPPWQLSQYDLWQATRISSVCTTAWLDNRLVGYQLSTRHRDAGHLARLAVSPEVQGEGIGGALVNQMIGIFTARYVVTVTVNTQLSNRRSQHLYEVYGFRRNGYDMSVWKYELTE